MHHHGVAGAGEAYQRFQARASTATETSVKPDACDSPPSG
ncbi:DUF3330 domain-containing protein [Escherichia coli]|nr:DUF3330 domain-containing protein [Acinetobacter baumannii]MDM9368334.1 DUF3330 domain-containing protein [Escherichia coli]